MTNIQILTLCVAVVGACTGIGGLVLGVLNYRHQIRQSKTKIRVVPSLAFRDPMDAMVSESYLSGEVRDAIARLTTYACIEVTNLSAVRQTIVEVGWITETGDYEGWRQAEVDPPHLDFPVHLRPDEAIKVYLPLGKPVVAALRPTAYARTHDGGHFQGRSPVIDDLLREHRGTSVYETRGLIRLDD